MDKKEFEMQKKLEELKFEEMKTIESIKMETIHKSHELRMEELKFFRTTEKLKHDWELERQRIKSAEIRKGEERRALRENQQRPGRY